MNPSSQNIQCDANQQIKEDYADFLTVSTKSHWTLTLLNKNFLFFSKTKGFSHMHIIYNIHINASRI